MANKIQIEVAYGLAQRQHIYRYEVAQGTTARQAVLQSDVLRDYPQADLSAPVGIFGKMVRDDTPCATTTAWNCIAPCSPTPKKHGASAFKNNRKIKMTIKIKMIVGLGNIGTEYEHTRHNAGFWLIDELAWQWKVNLREEKNSTAKWRVPVIQAATFGC